MADTQGEIRIRGTARARPAGRQRLITRQGGRRLDAASNAEIDLGYARIREVGENVIAPAILRVAAEDPTRSLAGFDRRIKGEDRLKEKISDRMRSKGRSATEALAQIADVVRFTFTYHETAYTDGVRKDLERLETAGSPRSNDATPGHPTSTRESIRNGWNRDLGYASKCSFTLRPVLRRKS